MSKFEKEQDEVAEAVFPIIETFPHESALGYSFEQEGFEDTGERIEAADVDADVDAEEIVAELEGEDEDDPNILEDADETVGTRAREYGPPTENFRCIADMWSGYLGIDITPYDYSQMMILAKIGRTKTGDPDRDTHQDQAGYSLTTSLVNQDGSDPGEYHGGSE